MVERRAGQGRDRGRDRVGEGQDRAGQYSVGARAGWDSGRAEAGQEQGRT